MTDENQTTDTQQAIYDLACKILDQNEQGKEVSGDDCLDLAEMICNFFEEEDEGETEGEPEPGPPTDGTPA